MTEIRCKKCNRLLIKADVLDGVIKCPKCKYVQEVRLGIDWRKQPLKSFSPETECEIKKFWRGDRYSSNL